jgi:protein-disulfide isomerase
MKRYLPFVIISVVALATVGGGAVMYRAMQPHLLGAPQKPDQAGENPAAMHIRGNPKARVTLEEFGDFQCAPCGLVASLADDLVTEYQPNLRLVFRNFPLEKHKHAGEAALAAEAASLQGKFWEMHDLLYREQRDWIGASNVRELFHEYAKKLGLNLEQFEKDLTGEQVKAAIAADMGRGKSMGVTGTPAFFVNGRGLTPSERSRDGLRAVIDAELKATATK